jgi:hypothetical protein
VGEDQVVHAEAGEQAVCRREVAAQLPFLWINIASVGHCPHHGPVSTIIGRMAVPNIV